MIVDYLVSVDWCPLWGTDWTDYLDTWDLEVIVSI